MAFSDAPLEFDEQGRIIISRPINWNHVEDPLDLEVWNKLVSQFWLPERIALSNDRAAWDKMTPEEQLATGKVFAGLAGLDTLQSSVGAPSMAQDAITQHEVAILQNIAFMEAVHAKSYSAFNATLLTSEDIERDWRWFAENDQTQYKIRRITEFYHGKDPIMKKAASTLLESFLFYSGFYLPLYWSSQGKLTNTADMIKLIIRDEATHGLYLGMRYQTLATKLAPEAQEALKESVIDLLMDLYDNEVKYAEEIYDPLGLTEDVKKFMHYNANKALQNLGYEGLFPPEECDFSRAVMASLSTTSENHDFFSQAGSSYLLAPVAEMSDDDFDWE